LRKFPKDYKLLTISITNAKKNWVAAVTGNTKSRFKGMGKWGEGSREKGVASGETGKLAGRPEIIVSKSIVKYRQTEFHFRNSLHFYFERLILLR
jgi:hypothetical protein